MADLQVEGRVLAWARRLSGISIEEAASRAKLHPDELTRLERPGPRLLKQSTIARMARKYRVPYGSFFMKQPLPIDEPKQYRTFRGHPPRLSEETLLAWAAVSEAVESFDDWRTIDGTIVQIAKLPKATRHDDVALLARAERARLGVTLAEQYVWTEAQARNGWRQAIESLGVFVYFMKMPRRDCMGFSLVDDRGIPAICVNDSNDLLESQKIFTMLHEYCHLLLREPGISDQGKGNVVERFCNQFAAAVLVPTDALRAVLPGGGPLRDWTTRELKRVANRFNVSMEVVALRIEELKMSEKGFHDRKVKEWNALKLLQRKQTTSHPNVTWSERAARRLGRRHTMTVFKALDSRAIGYSEARDMIGLSPRHFESVKAALE